MFILLTHSSENGRFGRFPKPSTAKSRRLSRLLRDLRFVSKFAVLPQDSRIFRIHIFLNFKILFLEACRFQNSEGLTGLKNTPKLKVDFSRQNFIFIQHRQILFTAVHAISHAMSLLT